MIVINVNRNQQGYIQSFTMDGHANSGPHGYDLVCASASSLAFGSINALEALCGLDANAMTELVDNGGYLRCKLPEDIPQETQEKIQLLLEGMLVSFQTIEAEYSKHIKINDTGGETYVKA